MRAQLTWLGVPSSTARIARPASVARLACGQQICPWARRRPLPTVLVRTTSPDTEEARSPLDAPQVGDD